MVLCQLLYITKIVNVSDITVSMFATFENRKYRSLNADHSKMKSKYVKETLSSPPKFKTDGKSVMLCCQIENISSTKCHPTFLLLLWLSGIYS